MCVKKKNKNKVQKNVLFPLPFKEKGYILFLLYALRKLSKTKHFKKKVAYGRLSRKNMERWGIGKTVYLFILLWSLNYVFYMHVKF